MEEKQDAFPEIALPQVGEFDRSTLSEMAFQNLLLASENRLLRLACEQLQTQNAELKRLASERGG